jgi:hypothetical protein
MQSGTPWYGQELQKELNGLQYPLYYTDFETVNPCIPRFSGMRPYDQLPFQWSVHVQRESGAAPEHFEYLATDQSDPRPAFISALCDALGDCGSIVVYHQQFECPPKLQPRSETGRFWWSRREYDYRLGTARRP